MLIRIKSTHHPRGLTNVVWNIGDIKSVPGDLGAELINLWHAEPAPGVEPGDDWDYLRTYIGERPGDPYAVINARNYLPFARAGQRILIIRKVGGLGDVLHCSLMLPEIMRQYPQCELTFATARQYHNLFDGAPFRVIDQDDVWRGATVRDGVISLPIADQYDIIEDVSTPCYLYESTQTYFGRDKLKWRPRLEIWSEWIGLKMAYEILECPVKITNEEQQQARDAYWPTPPYTTERKKAIALCPTSSNYIRSLSEGRWKPLKAELERKGYQVAVFGVPYESCSHECKDSRAYVAAMLAADCVVTVDSAASNIAGIWKKPCVALYGMTHGETYTRYYPTVRPLQWCETPCMQQHGTGCSMRTPCCYNKFDAIKLAENVDEVLYEAKCRMRGEDVAESVGKSRRTRTARKRVAVPKG